MGVYNIGHTHTQAGNLKVCEVDEELQKKLKKFRFRKATNNAAIVSKYFRLCAYHVALPHVVHTLHCACVTYHATHTCTLFDMMCLYKGFHMTQDQHRSAWP